MKEPEPWQIAAAAKTPIPASPAEERQSLEIELLAGEPQRRITVQEHQAWRDSLVPQPEETDE